jgi:hypothetical protein
MSGSNAQLGDRAWFNGDRFGWGDLCRGAVCQRRGGVRSSAAQPGRRWRLARVRANARDSVAACARAAAAVGFDSDAVSLDAVRSAMEQGLFKREYRDHRLEWMIKSGGIEVVQQGLEKGNIRFIEPFPS